MEIVITRFACYHQAMSGRLYVNGDHVCDTLENVEHCLPTGTYSVSIKRCQRLRRKMIFVGEDAIISAGNGAYGCKMGEILVGECRHLGFLIHTNEYFMPLYDRIRKTLARGHEVSVVIENVKCGIA